MEGIHDSNIRTCPVIRGDEVAKWGGEVGIGEVGEAKWGHP